MAKNKRMKEIDNIVDLMDDAIAQNTKTTNSQIDIILTKFPELKNYKFMNNGDIAMGTIIKCVDLDLKKVSIPAIIVNIEYYASFNKLKTIKYITVVNNFKKSYWRLKPKKYYMFQYDDNDHSGLKSALERLLGDEINKYKEFLKKSDTK
jgi:hypothetical protein